MRKVRSFDQNPPVYPATAHPVYSSPRGNYVRVLALPCIPHRYLSSRYTTSSWVTHTVMRRQHGDGCTPYRWYAPHTLDYETIACASTSGKACAPAGVLTLKTRLHELITQTRRHRIRSFWRCPPQNDRGQCLFSAPGLGWNIRGASQRLGGGFGTWMSLKHPAFTITLVS